MRSRILSPVLCLLVAFLFSSSPAFSTMKTTSVKPKSADNKTVKSVDTSTYFFNNLVLSTQKKVNENPINEVNSKPQPIDVVEEENTSNEEFSYKNAILNGVGNATGVQEKQTNLADSQSLFRNGMFYGFSLMVVLLNLVCFFLFEEKVFLFYSFALTSVTTSLIYSDSLFELIGLNGIENIAAMQSTLLLIATACIALFASKYLTLSEYAPKLKWFSMGLLAFAFMMVFSGWISETQLFTGIANTALFTVMTLYFSAGVALFSKKNYAKFYVIAYSIPLLFAFDFFVLKKFGIDFLFTESFHLKAATIVEMLIITYAIMYRMRAIKEEHLIKTNGNAHIFEATRSNESNKY